MKNNLMAAIIVFVLVIVLTIGAIFYQNNSSDNSSPTVATEDSKPPETTTTSATSYKDGTYSVDGIYQTPDNEEKIGVTITLKDNVITAAEVEGKGVLATSQKYQELFISGYKPQVVGKNINEVSLTRVSGSSLTPNGFNDAISKIKEQAKV